MAANANARHDAIRPGRPTLAAARRGLEERRRVPVEVERGARMLPKHRGRPRRRDGKLEAVAHGRGLAPVGHDARGSRATSGSGGSTSRSRARGRPRAGGTSPRRAAGGGRPRRASTTRYGSSVSKSAGGSLKARWPFSPMPTKATSMGCRRGACRRAGTRHRGRAPRRSTKWKAPGWTRSTIRSRRYRRKLAGCVSGRPTYSSRWKKTTFAQSMPGAATSAARNSNCEAPVAAIARASPLAVTAAFSAAAARAAAASAISLFESKTSVSMVLTAPGGRGGRRRASPATAWP